MPTMASREGTTRHSQGRLPRDGSLALPIDNSGCLSSREGWCCPRREWSLLMAWCWCVEPPTRCRGFPPGRPGSALPPINLFDHAASPQKVPDGGQKPAVNDAVDVG